VHEATWFLKCAVLRYRQPGLDPRTTCLLDYLKKRPRGIPIHANKFTTDQERFSHNRLSFELHVDLFVVKITLTYDLSFVSSQGEPSCVLFSFLISVYRLFLVFDFTRFAGVDSLSLALPRMVGPGGWPLT
jgi:hypothetical protein